MDSMKSVRHLSEMAAQWPTTASTASPIIGFARDGYPIFGPYDENGDLQRGMDFGGDLDECNGKMNSAGSYGYYLTVDPPFAPPCLRGEIGLFTSLSTNKLCPADGIVNTIINQSDGFPDAEFNAELPLPSTDTEEVPTTEEPSELTAEDVGTTEPLPAEEPSTTDEPPPVEEPSTTEQAPPAEEPSTTESSTTSSASSNNKRLSVF